MRLETFPLRSKIRLTLKTEAYGGRLKNRFQTAFLQIYKPKKEHIDGTNPPTPFTRTHHVRADDARHRQFQRQRPRRRTFAPARPSRLFLRQPLQRQLLRYPVCR